MKRADDDIVGDASAAAHEPVGIAIAFEPCHSSPRAASIRPRTRGSQARRSPLLATSLVIVRKIWRNAARGAVLVGSIIGVAGEPPGAKAQCPW